MHIECLLCEAWIMPVAKFACELIDVCNIIVLKATIAPNGTRSSGKCLMLMRRNIHCRWGRRRCMMEDLGAASNKTASRWWMHTSGTKIS
mmetsp:Transcript_21360/g.31992  ORF Transcript_21360/g.31992 Transcript_21360/m.31992 type:complete len:90 (+) Transcript_21360:610-879(+)